MSGLICLFWLAVVFEGAAAVLVLSRRASESVMVGQDIVITVLEVRGDVVRLGISAPREVQVHREEVWRALQEQNAAAASPSEAAVEHLSTLLPGRKGREEGR